MMQDYLENTKPIDTLIEGLFERVHVGNSYQKQLFIKESVEDKNIAKYLFALREAAKSNNSLHQVFQVLSNNTKNIQADLKNRIENSTNEVIREIISAKGDISKVKIIGKINRLLTISVATNDKHLSNLNRSMPHSDVIQDKMRVYNNAAMDILKLIDVMNRHSSQFRKLIASEASKPYAQQFYNQLFVNICLFIQIYGNALYASSVEIDKRTLNTLRSVGVGRISIEVKDSTSPVTLVYLYDRELMDEPMSIINTIKREISNGRIFNTRESGITEQFMDHVDNGVIINEGFLDVLSSLLTKTSVGQFLLIPVYFVRSVTYLILYLGETYTAISNSIDKSLKLLSSKTLTEKEFDTYKKDAHNIAVQSVNQLNSSQMAIKHELDRTKSAVNPNNDNEIGSSFNGSQPAFI